jgi:hypothetical protein
MSKAEELFLKTWKNRRCNIGDCPAFHLTEQDVTYLVDAEKIRKEKGMEAAVEELGVPSGTCRITGREMVVNSDCVVSDDNFVGHFQK